MKNDLFVNENLHYTYIIPKYVKDDYLSWCNDESKDPKDKYNFFDYLFCGDISDYESGDIESDGLELDNTEFLEWLTND